MTDDQTAHIRADESRLSRSTARQSDADRVLGGEEVIDDITSDTFSADLTSYVAATPTDRLAGRLAARLDDPHTTAGHIADRGSRPAGSSAGAGADGEAHRVGRGPDLDLVWTTHDTALGPLLLAFREGAVIRVAFENEGFDAVVDALAERLGRRTLRASRPADDLRRQLDDYLAGGRRTLDVRHDLVLSSAPFRRAVQESLPRIPYGRTASYAAVAASAGRPKAVRAVGSACATNPLPLVLPCHRVLRSDGSLGEYLGGPATKRALLDLERTHAGERL